MNILIVSTSDMHGGAAIAAYRLMEALLAEKENVKMLVSKKQSSHPAVILTGSRLSNKLNFYRERGIIFLQNRLSRQYLFDVSIANSGLSITDLPEFKQADIIHLHWINQGMLSLNEIGYIISSGKKVVWTMHDMWSFTGICHHAAGCRNYTHACGLCPYLQKSGTNDLSHQLFLKKQHLYAKGNITFVACSNWLKELALQSPLTKDHHVVSIPNPINTNLYAPTDREAAREKLHLPKNQKIILFVAVKASDPRKGMAYLAEASRVMARQRQDILFLIAGNHGKEMVNNFALPAQSLGYVATDDMPAVYAAADLFVTPSLQENLPNTLMEAMSCGIPCVGFHTGGIPEMIDHQVNGYVAAYKDPDDLANGMLWILSQPDAASLSTHAREKALSQYNQQIVAKQYLKIYEGV
jgi:glycosyltransferase involved in cell wall biosynthesis